MTGHRNKKKWHARSSDGVAVECNAEFHQCPRTKDGEPHVYASTPQEAQQKIDAIKAEYMGKDLFASAFSKGRKVTQQPVGAGDNSPDRGKQWESMSLVEQGRECERVLQEACDSHQAISGLDMSLRHQYAERALSQAIRDGLKTSDTYSTKISAGPVYTPERRKLQQQIIDDVFKQHEDTPCEGKAIISGGMGGAGKTTVLTRYLNIDTDKYITVNPDDIKEIMAERGMIPTLRGLTPMECSTLAHDEASHISSIIMDWAIREKKNIILDGTMSKRSSMDSRVGRLKKGGYSLRAVFVDITPETSTKRATSRYRRGMDKYTVSGEGNGGRILPASVNQGNTPEDPTRFRSRSAENLASMHADGTIETEPVVFNNDGDAPRPVPYSDFIGRLEISDQYHRQ